MRILRSPAHRMLPGWRDTRHTPSRVGSVPPCRTADSCAVATDSRLRPRHRSRSRRCVDTCRPRRPRDMGSAPRTARDRTQDHSSWRRDPRTSTHRCRQGRDSRPRGFSGSLAEVVAVVRATDTTARKWRRMATTERRGTFRASARARGRSLRTYVRRGRTTARRLPSAHAGAHGAARAGRASRADDARRAARGGPRGWVDRACPRHVSRSRVVSPCPRYSAPA